MEQYLIWSNEHKAWWGPNGNGYVRRVENAGSYSRIDAMNICFNAMPGRSGSRPLQEIPILYSDIDEMLNRFEVAYPNHDPEPERYD